MRKELTQERLKEVLDYNPETGDFIWKVQVSNKKKGSVAGTLTHDGYWQIGLDGKVYRANRLAWLYVYGAWPEGDVDHRYGIRLDNRIGELRDVTRSGNNQNRRGATNNKTTGLLGASLVKRKGKYQAQIKVNGKQNGLGLYNTAEEAHQVYIEAKRRLHTTCTI